MRDFIRLSWHVVVRNWQVYKKDLLANISPTVTDPIFTILAFGIGLGPFLNDIDGLTYRQYIAPGVAVTSALFTSYFESSYGFYVRMTFENIFKAMLTTPMGVPEVVAGELAWVAIKGGFMATTVGLVMGCFGLVSYWPWMLALPFIGGAVALSCGALGLIYCTMVNNIDQFQLSYSYVILPMYYFSGIFFPVTQFPPWLQVLVNFSPLYHGARLAQMAFWNDFHFIPALEHVAALALFAALFISIALRRVKKKLIL